MSLYERLESIRRCNKQNGTTSANIFTEQSKPIVEYLQEIYSWDS